MTDLLPVQEDSLVEMEEVRVRIDLDGGHDDDNGDNVESFSGCKGSCRHVLVYEDEGDAGVLGEDDRDVEVDILDEDDIEGGRANMSFGEEILGRERG